VHRAWEKGEGEGEGQGGAHTRLCLRGRIVTFAQMRLCPRGYRGASARTRLCPCGHRGASVRMRFRLRVHARVRADDGRRGTSARTHFFTVGADGKNPSVSKNESAHGRPVKTDLRTINFTVGRPFRHPWRQDQPFATSLARLLKKRNGKPF
jgi:hypothetical protein